MKQSLADLVAKFHGAFSSNKTGQRIAFWSPPCCAMSRGHSLRPVVDFTIMTAPTEVELQHRIEELKSPACSANFVLDYYGIDTTSSALVAHIERWASASRVKRKFVHDDKFNRITLELYFQSNQFLPRKWAAAALGMTLGSFDETLTALKIRGPFLPVGEVIDAVVSERFISGFASNFRETGNRIFGDHQDFCHRIHAAIKAELSVVVEPLWSKASTQLDAGAEPDFAHQFDCISLEPLGLRHQVWLNFDKPMRLAPDKCSTVTFAKYRSALQQFSFGGTAPEITAETESAAKHWAVGQ